jgi:hypothetical protein
MEKIKNMTKEEKISWTIMALNDGSDDAMRMAYDIRMSVEDSDDQELKERIEYLWEII